MSSIEKNDRSEFLTVQEVARLTNYDHRRIRQFLREGKLQGHKLEGGRKWIIPRGEIDLILRTSRAVTELEGEQSNQANSRDAGISSRALVMEQSGHWPGLRKTAATLQEQLSAPLHQHLGLEEWGIHNSCLVLDSSTDRFEVTLKIEEDLIF